MSYFGLWPTISEFKKIVDVPQDDDHWDVTLERQLASGIAIVKEQVGTWDEVIDMPDDQLSGAALRAAYLLSLKESPAQIIHDPVFATYMHGHHRRYSFA